MLWKPHAPLYPPLITDTPGDLKVHEARALRKRGLKIMPLTILSKNAYYGDLIQHVREAFGDEELVRIDCKGLNVSDYKKIGAKLRDLVPCYLLSFQKDQVILWRGRENMLDHINCSESANTEAADIHSVDHEKNIHVMNDACNKTLSGKTESELNGSDENDTVAKDIFESGHEDDSPDPRESTANLNAHTADEIDASSFSDFCWTSEEETEELDACSKSDFCRLSDEKAAWRA
ncbi:hypothetical protein KP509_14G027700 [Ceratopteris richardii]|nr:hypothetical protein KP509_14G027700 [Ceratopteris richardii]